MKKRGILKFLVLIITICYTSNIFSQVNIAKGVGYDWDELTNEDQKKIIQATQNYVELINSKQFDNFWESTHSIFKSSTPKLTFKQYEDYLSSVACPTDSIKFINAKKIVYTNPTIVGQVVTGGSLDTDDDNYLQFTAFPNILEQVIVVFEIPVSPIKKSLVLKFGVENEKYKLTNIEINSRSVGEKDTQYFKDLSVKWKLNENLLPEFLALYFAYKLSYLGKDVKNKDHVEIVGKLALIQKNQSFADEFSKWEIDKEIYDIVNFDLLETKYDISPKFLYVSKNKLGKETTTKEARKLLNYLTKKYPMLKNEFDVFLFQAYEEYPKNPLKQYKCYNVPLNLNE